MGAYEYTALDAGGRQRKGVLEGDTARQVRQALREQGMIPLNLDEVVRQEGKKRGPVLRGGVSATDLAVVTRQLATLVRSGLPLEEALTTVGEQTEKPRLKSLMMGVRSRVLEGRSLADGLADFPSVFPELYRATVAAGEQSGHLDVVLERLADYTEKRQQMRQKMTLALLYPTLLTFVALAVVGLLLTYVVPQVVQVFENVGRELPWLTTALIAVSDFLIDNGVLLLVAGGMIGFAFWRLLKRPGFRYRVHQMLLRAPLSHRLVRGLNTGRFARTFSILAASGVPVLEGMRISAQVLSNIPMRAAVDKASERVREGSSISRALESSGLFPPLTLHLIASGESSGRLEEMLERAADNQEREIETLVAVLMGVFEPVLLLAMGGVVLIIVLAILVPILELNQLVM
ncbi:type II secretion system inner membrane protein GspF [Thiohalomonas denitrificans]|uniref:General secretion pathway protein F n=1 Tax=Thiohalomonas denitrificans TaxID=415747 RepID=A0A1G5QCS0_9GAMM|nr:type II secretion system inner membrane protein GspF [Thiohalomonas denitrificans]SCZ59643.1 general secretion pathway protein F [Thiohalomonas denitrificans]